MTFELCAFCDACRFSGRGEACRSNDRVSVGVDERFQSKGMSGTTKEDPPTRPRNYGGRARRADVTVAYIGAEVSAKTGSNRDRLLRHHVLRPFTIAESMSPILVPI